MERIAGMVQTRYKHSQRILNNKLRSFRLGKPGYEGKNKMARIYKYRYRGTKNHKEKIEMKYIFKMLGKILKERTKDDEYFETNKISSME